MSTSRPTPPAATAASAARRPDRWMPWASSRPSTKALSTRARSAPVSSGVRASVGVGVAGVGQHRTVGLDPEPVRLDGVVDAVCRDRERADGAKP